jgi:hypothetical protein
MSPRAVRRGARILYVKELVPCAFSLSRPLLPSDKKERWQATQSENARQLAKAANRRSAPRMIRVLVDLRQGTHVQFERLIVLPFDL